MDNTLRNSLVFDDRAAEYDGWFDANPVFDAELAALQQLQTPFAKPRLEIGIGPGRFASALEIGFGIDPAFNPLLLAARRGIKVCRGLGESLPLRTGQIGTVFLLFTLCFVTDPEKVLEECFRILKPGGHCILGTVPLENAWGRMLDKKRADGHPFYQYARFVALPEIRHSLSEAGFSLVEGRSTLLGPPASHDVLTRSEDGISEDAGFVIMVGQKGMG